ncbi:YqzE-like protein [Melghiribacillus thermohalophilus]|uniref:YqzE-like protein n=1 Tax=Melghiribacillus thermohalophilus TaxID=1324956 RepID=A0A4R3NDF8_9BACI|nr:YqzE family protein [Melghiribacillus thermohalophilus]TCT26950.1 YqzE-like protein [Melghiribacillus thermohalophilus]
MSGNDLVKMMTQELLKYMHTPKVERKRKKELKKAQKEARAIRYFGLIPFALKMFFDTKKRRMSVYRDKR